MPRTSNSGVPHAERKNTNPANIDRSPSFTLSGAPQIIVGYANPTGVNSAGDVWMHSNSNTGRPARYEQTESAVRSLNPHRLSGSIPNGLDGRDRRHSSYKCRM